MKYPLFLNLFVTLLLQSCVKKAQDCPVNFQIPAQTLPYSEQYQIGDTITVISEFHKEVYELNTDKRYDMEGIEWFPGLGVARIDNDSVDVNFRTKDYFDLVENSKYGLEWFTYSDGATQIDGVYNFQNDTFDIEVKIIAQSTGIYNLRFGSQLFASKQWFPGKCKRSHFQAQTTMNVGEDNHIHLLEESPNPHFNTWVLQKTDERFYAKGDFCFSVVE